MGAATPTERQALLDKDLNMRRYATPIDPRSAHEVLLERTAARLKQAEEAELAERAARTEGKSKAPARGRESAGEAFLKSVARAAGSSLGRKLFRGLLGSLLK
ncbi:MAG: helicase HerA-like domain-containing protein [Halioglobus sp.]